MRAVKYTFLIVITLLITAFVSAAVWLITLNPSEVKTRLAKALSQQLGHTVVLQGDLHWSLLPEVALEANQVSIQSNAQFGNSALLKAESIRFQLQIAPLLHRKIVIQEVDLRHGNLALAINAVGDNNWGNKKSASSTSSNAAWATLMVRKINLTDFTIHFDDAKHQHHAVLTQADYVGTAFLNPHQHAKWLLQGDLTAASLQMDKLRFDQLQTHVLEKQDALHLQNMKTHWYDGELAANIDINQLSTQPSFAIDANVSKVDLKPMFSDLHYLDHITGTLEGHLQIKVADFNQFFTNMNGKIEMHILDGVIHGIDLKHKLNILSHIILPKILLKAPTHQTEFKAISGDIAINNGIASSKDLAFDSDTLAAFGEWTADLAKHTFDVHMNMHVQNDSSTKQFLLVQTCMGGNFPVRISGSFSDYKTDLATTELVARCTASGVINTIGGAPFMAQSQITALWHRVTELLP